MNKVSAIEAPKLNRPKLYSLALVYAGVVVLATTYLLYKLDKIIDFIMYHGVGGGRTGVAATLVVATTGVLALPYLLRMTVSPLMRILGFVSSFVVVLGWLLGAWWLQVNIGDSKAAAMLLAAHIAGLLSLVSAWAIGIPSIVLKKRR